MVEGYKHATANNKATGNAPSKFEFLKEIGELIGDRHDVNFPVILTQNRTTDNRRVEERNEEDLDNDQIPDEEVRPDTPSSQSSTPSTRRKRKRCNRDAEREDTAMKHLEQMNSNILTALERNQTSVMQYMSEQQQSFERMFMALIQGRANTSNT